MHCKSRINEPVPEADEPVAETVWKDLDQALSLEPYQMTTEIINKLEKEYPDEWKGYCEWHFGGGLQ